MVIRSLLCKGGTEETQHALVGMAQKVLFLHGKIEVPKNFVGRFEQPAPRMIIES